MTTNTCFVCCEKFNLSYRRKVECSNPECNFLACKTCTRQYLLNNVNDVHCMNCKQAWDQTFVVLNLNRNWYNDVYQEHRNQLLFEREQSRFPDTMPEVEKYHKISEINKEREVNMKSINALRSKIEELVRENNNCDRKIRVIKTGKEEVERQKFIMPCQKGDCKGFLSTAYKCGVCKDYCCPQCFAILGETKDEDHVCKDSDIETAKLIKATTRPCPNCGERINKISGCDQMWCPTCRTAFSWKDGTIQNGTIHNPHYFQYMRNRNNGDMPRQPGDNPCADNAQYLNQIIQCLEIKLYKGRQFTLRRSAEIQPHYHRINHDIVTTNQDNEDERVNEYIEYHDQISILNSLFRLFRHVEQVELRDLQNQLTRLNNTVEERVNFIVNVSSKEQFVSEISTKDKQRKKVMDLIYIYDLIRTVGGDILNGVFEIVGGNMHLSPNEITAFIEEMDNEELFAFFASVIDKADKFIQYCNTQFEIIGVSHNSSSKCFKNSKNMEYQSFRHLQGHVLNSHIQWGYVTLHKYDLVISRKARISDVKKHYLKS